MAGCQGSSVHGAAADGRVMGQTPSMCSILLRVPQLWTQGAVMHARATVQGQLQVHDSAQIWTCRQVGKCSMPGPFTCDSDGVGSPLHVRAHKAHHLGKAHITLQAV